MVSSDFSDNLADADYKIKTKWCNTNHLVQRIPKGILDFSGISMMMYVKCLAYCIEFQNRNI